MPRRIAEPIRARRPIDQSPCLPLERDKMYKRKGREKNREEAETAETSTHRTDRSKLCKKCGIPLKLNTSKLRGYCAACDPKARRYVV